MSSGGHSPTHKQPILSSTKRIRPNSGAGVQLQQAEPTSAFEASVPLPSSPTHRHWAPVEDGDRQQALKLKAEGDEHTRNRRFVEAEACYTRSLKADPTSPNVWGNRSLVSLKLNRFDDAVADAQRATELAPDWAKGWARLGAAERANGQPVQAALAYRQALHLEPKNKEFDRLLSEVEAECNMIPDPRQTVVASSAVVSSEPLPGVIPHNVNELVLLQNDEPLQWLRGATSDAASFDTLQQVMTHCLQSIPMDGLSREEQLAFMMKTLEKEAHKIPKLDGMIHACAKQRNQQKKQAYSLVPTLPIHDEHWCVSWTVTGPSESTTGRRFYVVTVMVMTGKREGMIVGSEQWIDLPDGNIILTSLFCAMAFPMPMVGPPRRPSGVLVANSLIQDYALIAGELLAVDIPCRLERKVDADALREHMAMQHQDEVSQHHAQL